MNKQGTNLPRKEWQEFDKQKQERLIKAEAASQERIKTRRVSEAEPAEKATEAEVKELKK